MTYDQKQFIASLREFRPELAEFLGHCERGHVLQVQCDFARQRVHYLAGAGREQGYDAIAQLAGELEYVLNMKGKPAELAACTRNLLDAAMHTLTFIASKPGARPEFPRLKNGKKAVIVIADDDRIVREMMQEIFAGGTELHAAGNGKEAYDLIRRHHPDLVILDDFMPGMTGLKLIEMLHASQEFSDIPVVMLTASDRQRDMERAMQAGAVDYITKPFSPDNIADRAYEWLKMVK